MQCVIPSRGRAQSIGENTLRVVPDALVCVGESEAAAYGAVTSNLLVHPDDVVGIGPLRQWVLDNVADPVVVMLDDDIKGVYWKGDIKQKRIDDPDHVRAVIERVAIMAADAGARVFGFAQAQSPMEYKAFEPFALSTWVGGVVGVIGRELRYDTSLILRADIDFCLKSLLRDRFVWVETRYCFQHVRFAGRGGNASNRSSERHRREIDLLLKRWGRHISHRTQKGTTCLKIRVPRRR